jgi:hypothetical protein
MVETSKGEGRRWSPWRILGWGIGASMLLLPAVAMQFTDEVNWTAFDFLFAGAMIGGVGLLFELAVRSTRNSAYRAGVGAALAAAFLTVWANGAVGMIGSEHNPYNFLFIGVIAVALLGALIALFRPAGMALAMLVAAVGQACAGLGGLSADPRGAVLSTGFAGLWLLSAALFRKAAREQGRGEIAARA